MAPELDFTLVASLETDRRTLCVVIPMYNEGARLRENIQKIHDCLREARTSFCILLVDDGSTDDTWDACRTLASELPVVRALRFSRNFGKEAAILCGLREAPGDAVIVMDSDLQHPPELLGEMIRRWRDEDCDVVAAVKASRGRESFYRRWTAHLFYRTMRFLSGFDIAGQSDYKLLSRKVIQAYVDLPETNRFFRGLVAWLGYRTAVIPFHVPPASGRDSRWSWAHLLRLGLSVIAAFSYVPLQLITVAGVLTFFFSFILGIQTLWMKWSGRAVEGFTTVILVVLFAGSVIMLSLGVIGEYLAKIYDELKRRPNYVVTSRLGEDRMPAPPEGKKVTGTISGPQ